MRAGLSARSLRSLFSHSHWGRGGMTGEPRLCADQGVCYCSETIKRQTKGSRHGDKRERDCSLFCMAESRIAQCLVRV
jgi:hypothetical protein